MCISLVLRLGLKRFRKHTYEVKPHVQACSVVCFGCVYMYREEQLTSLQSGEEYDVLVIGGGATGVGVALDATTRGTYVRMHICGLYSTTYIQQSREHITYFTTTHTTRSLLLKLVPHRIYWFGS